MNYWKKYIFFLFAKGGKSNKFFQNTKKTVLRKNGISKLRYHTLIWCGVVVSHLSMMMMRFKIMISCCKVIFLSSVSLDSFYCFRNNLCIKVYMYVYQCLYHLQIVSAYFSLRLLLLLWFPREREICLSPDRFVLISFFYYFNFSLSLCLRKKKKRIWLE